MRTRNNKNNLSQSKTNNESNFLVNKNDINMYLNKYIFNKKKTRNRNDNGLLCKQTFNISTQKYDINGLTNVSNKTFLNNYTKNFNNQNKIAFIKSRNKIPSCLKGRPNTIFNKNNNILFNKIQKKKILKDKNDISSNGKTKKRNISMIGYSNIININLNNNNNNQNLTERETNKIIVNKSPDKNKKLTRHNKVLSGIYINLSNLEHLSKKEINSERNNKDKNYIGNISQNKSNVGMPNVFHINKSIYKSKLSFMSSKSISKSKSKSKSKNKKNTQNYMLKARTKSNFTNSYKISLIEDISKLKNFGKNTKNIFEISNQNKFSKEIYLMHKKIGNSNHKNINNSNYINDNINLIINSNDKSSGALTSRTRNLKTYNIFFKTNSIDIEKTNKINELNNKENYSINPKMNPNNLNNNNNNNARKTNVNLNNNLYSKIKRNSLGNKVFNQNNYMKKFGKKNISKNISKNNTEKNLFDNNLFFSNGMQKLNINKYNKKNYKK
jgi:hypothetical protein